MPCSLVGHMQPASALHLLPRKPGSDGPPHARSSLPSESSSRTAGAALQQSETGPNARTWPSPLIGCPFSSEAPGTGPSSPASSVASVRGRWYTQIWSCWSTYSPPTWPTSQLFGKDCGHDGSTTKLGVLPLLDVL